LLVVKAGGRILESNMHGILNSIAKYSGRGVVFVHGGGDIVSRYEKALGIEPKIVVSPSGVRSRLTDEREIEVYNMVMAGKIGKEASAYLNHRGVKAVSLSGVDGALLKAQRKKRIIIIDERGRKRAVEGGYTGSITDVNTELLTNLTNLGYVAVVSPVALGEEGEMLNVDGDMAASAIAAAVKAETLILLTDVEGLIIENQLINKLTVNEAESLLEKIGPGMNRKVIAATRAVKRGTAKAVICSGTGEDPITKAENNKGTVITP